MAIAAYTPGVDLNPLSTDTDGIQDNTDPIPLIFNFGDGDLAPLGAPDGVLNAADALIATRIMMRMITPTNTELAHGDLYPTDAPDVQITMSDLLLIMKAVLSSS